MPVDCRHDADGRCPAVGLPRRRGLRGIRQGRPRRHCGPRHQPQRLGSRFAGRRRESAQPHRRLRRGRRDRHHGDLHHREQQHLYRRTDGSRRGYNNIWRPRDLFRSVGCHHPLHTHARRFGRGQQEVYAHARQLHRPHPRPLLHLMGTVGQRSHRQRQQHHMAELHHQ